MASADLINFWATGWVMFCLHLGQVQIQTTIRAALLCTFTFSVSLWVSLQTKIISGESLTSSCDGIHEYKPQCLWVLFAPAPHLRTFSLSLCHTRCQSVLQSLTWQPRMPSLFISAFCQFSTTLITFFSLLFLFSVDEGTFCPIFSTFPPWDVPF